MKKKSAHLDWEDIRYFICLADIGTLSGAARSMGVNHATVSRRLDRLEERLGVTLFDRRPDGYHLTADGASIYARAVLMRDNAEWIASHVEEGAGIAGVVRVTMTRALSDYFVTPRLTPLLSAHPGLRIDLITESRNMSLARREADVALRLARPSDGDMIGRRIGMLGYGFYTADGCGHDLRPAGQRRFIGYSTDLNVLPEAEWLLNHVDEEEIVFRSNSLATQLQAAEAGAGMALLPHFLARQAGTLRPVHLEMTPPTREVWLLVRPNVARTARVRAVIDLLVRLFDENRDLLANGPSDRT